MHRRRLLATVSTLGTVAVAGCLDDGSGDTPTPTPGPTVANSAFTLGRAGPGVETNQAAVSADGSTITVEGTIWSPNGCTTASLAGVDYDAAADELTVTVSVVDPEPTDVTEVGACATAIYEIDYRATVSMDNGLPGRVVVVHRNSDGATEVATATP